MCFKQLKNIVLLDEQSYKRLFVNFVLLVTYTRVRTSSGNHGKPGKSLSMHGKLWNLKKKTLENLEIL